MMDKKLSLESVLVENNYARNYYILQHSGQLLKKESFEA
jgi:hypothetical protein